MIFYGVFNVPVDEVPNLVISDRQRLEANSGYLPSQFKGCNMWWINFRSVGDRVIADLLFNSETVGERMYQHICETNVELACRKVVTENDGQRLVPVLIDRDTPLKPGDYITRSTTQMSREHLIKLLEQQDRSTSSRLLSARCVNEFLSNECDNPVIFIGWDHLPRVYDHTSDKYCSLLIDDNRLKQLHDQHVEGDMFEHLTIKEAKEQLLQMKREHYQLEIELRRSQYKIKALKDVIGQVLD